MNLFDAIHSMRAIESAISFNYRKNVAPISPGEYLPPAQGYYERRTA